MVLYPVAVCYNARQGSTIKYNTIQYNTSTVQYNKITHTTHNNLQRSRQNYKKNQERVLYSIKTQKRVEPTVEESVLKTTRYTKQSVNHTTQHSISHISPRPTPHSTPLPLWTLHIPPALIPFPSPHWANLHHTSIPFTSFHFASLITFQPLETDDKGKRQSALTYLYKSLKLQKPVTNASHSNSCVCIAP
jgi:hypothetical protein